jgi:hypothetical protein
VRYRFDTEEFTETVPMSRDERYDIMQYLSSARMEAEDAKDACRKLGEMAHGKYTWDEKRQLATITLPDYEDCKLLIAAVPVLTGR